MTNSNQKNIVIIGSGFSSISAACYLAKAGFTVKVLEKNTHIGGRARQLKKDGFLFDMGPTFYWMPDVFEKFFNDFNHSATDFYPIKKLNPAYRVYFGKEDWIEIPDNLTDIEQVFEQTEPGSSKGLKKFLANAKSNYQIAIQDLVYKPGESLSEIITPTTALKLPLFFDTIKNQVARHIKHPKLRKILEFPVLFLGAKPSNTPAFYNFMNHADFALGTWQPNGGMYDVVKAMEKIAIQFGVEIQTQQQVIKIHTQNKLVTAVETQNQQHQCDILLSGADYHHTEKLLPPKLRQYSETYWNKKTFAPSALLFYVGFNKKLTNITHHTLFFDTDFNQHAQEIYNQPQWPKDPLFYASFPSITSPNFAPEGKEAATILIPIAPGLTDTNNTREQYFNIVINRIEQLTNQDLKDHILFWESYSVNDFVQDYHSYKGNAYGLANTLLQTHLLRPKLHSKKIKNLYFTGQLTVPGPGVPPSIISGKIVSDLINKHYQS